MTQFKYTISARPTLYKRTMYRSELEAAWAAYFDIRGIQYEYEPLVGLTAWRPDFVILTDENKRYLTEVKPYMSLKDWKEDTPTLIKIRNSFSSYQEVFAIALGVSPNLPSNFLLSANGEGEISFEELHIADEHNQEDWNSARNLVRWKP